jgi:Major Facilitator Superfamily
VASYVVAALLLGVYFAMQSGTFDAIVYDTVLEEDGNSERFESILGRVRMLESAALVVGALGGGALAAVTAPRITYVATLPFVAVSTMLVLAFREPRLHEAGEPRSLRQHLAVTVGVLRHERRLLPIAALLVLTSILTQGIFEFGPLWLVDAEAGAGAFGPAWAGLMASLGFGGALAGRLRPDRTATVAVLGVLLVGSAATLLVTSDVVVVTVAQIITAVVSVVIGIFLTRQLHDAIPSEVRSGVASGVGAATWATFLPFALAFGAVSERWGVHTAGVLLVAVALAVAGLLAVTSGTDAATAAADESPEELSSAHDLAARPVAA